MPRGSNLDNSGQGVAYFKLIPNIPCSLQRRERPLSFSLLSHSILLNIRFLCFISWSFWYSMQWIFNRQGIVMTYLFTINLFCSKSKNTVLAWRKNHARFFWKNPKIDFSIAVLSLFTNDCLDSSMKCRSFNKLWKQKKEWINGSKQFIIIITGI